MIKYIKNYIKLLLYKWLNVLAMRLSSKNVTKYFDKPIINILSVILYGDLSYNNIIKYLYKHKFVYKTSIVLGIVLISTFFLGYSTSISVIDNAIVQKEITEYKLKHSVNELFNIKNKNDSLNDEINEIILSKDYLRFQAFHEIGIIIPKSIPHDDLKLMFQYAKKYNVPIKIALGVIYQECRFQKNVNASPAGALYYMQVMPDTYKFLAPKININTKQNNQTTIKVGMYFLRYLFELYKPNRTDNEAWSLTLAAYNAGPGAVEQYNGIPPFTETQNYVYRIMNCNHNN